MPNLSRPKLQSQLSRIPADYIRRQTLKGVERFTHLCVGSIVQIFKFLV
jgi:DNA mismatch repair ATPase MutS